MGSSWFWFEITRADQEYPIISNTQHSKKYRGDLRWLRRYFSYAFWSCCPRADVSKSEYYQIQPSFCILRIPQNYENEIQTLRTFGKTESIVFEQNTSKSPGCRSKGLLETSIIITLGESCWIRATSCVFHECILTLLDQAKVWLLHECILVLLDQAKACLFHECILALLDQAKACLFHECILVLLDQAKACLFHECILIFIGSGQSVPVSRVHSGFIGSDQSMHVSRVHSGFVGSAMDMSDSWRAVHN